MNQSEQRPQCICCNEPAEWVDKWCQEHWEAECSRTWWKMLGGETEDEKVCNLCGGSGDLHQAEIETALSVYESISACGWCDPPENP